jgi:PleD family two-component response regulator
MQCEPRKPVHNVLAEWRTEEGMNTDATAGRITALAGALPPRILVVAHDVTELNGIADRLTVSGFEVACATDGEQALAHAQLNWYPIVIADADLQVMDGIALTQALRRRGGADDTYVIMLTSREPNFDYERGYLSGVDNFLTRHVHDSELFAHIRAAFSALALRRSLKETRAALELATTTDSESGACRTRQLHTQLQTEVRRAQRYGRSLAVLTFGVESSAEQAGGGELLRGIVETIRGVIRMDVDWIGRLSVPHGAAFAVVLPEAGAMEAPVVKERIFKALRVYLDSLHPSVKLSVSVGLAALSRGGGKEDPEVDAEEMLDVTEHCRSCPGHSGPAQLATVQRSVTHHVAIACRHGYVVDAHCNLKADSHEPG